jgi:hypothetical protein
MVSIFPAWDRSADGIAANNDRSGAGVAWDFEVVALPGVELPSRESAS